MVRGRRSIKRPLSFSGRMGPHFHSDTFFGDAWDIHLFRLGYKDKNGNPDDKQDNEAEYTACRIASHLCGYADKQRAHNRREFAENIIKPEEFIGIFLRNNLGEVGTAQCLNASLGRCNEHRQYPEIERCLEEIGITADNDVDNDAGIEHRFSGKAVSQPPEQKGKGSSDNLGNKQDDEQVGGTDA